MYCQIAFDLLCQVLPSLPGNYLEIGVLDGDAIRELAMKFPGKIIYAIDPFIDDGNTTHITGVPEGQPLVQVRQNALNNIAGIPNIHLFEQTSQSFFRSQSQDDLDQLNISAVLIDGSHHYPDCFTDFQFALACLRHGGLIFADDLHVPDVIRARDEFVRDNTSRIRERKDHASSCELWITPTDSLDKSQLRD